MLQRAIVLQNDISLGISTATLFFHNVSHGHSEGPVLERSPC